MGFLGVPRVPLEGLGFHGEAWGSLREALGFLGGELRFLCVLLGSLGRLGVHWVGLGFLVVAWESLRRVRVT